MQQFPKTNPLPDQRTKLRRAPIDLRDEECGAALEASPHDKLPLTVVITPADAAACARAVRTLRELAVEIVSMNSLLHDGDPKLVADLVIIDAQGLWSTCAQAVREARTRWPSSLIINLNVPTEALASQLLESGADFALHTAVSELYARNVIGAAARRVNHMNAQLRITFGDPVFDRDARRVWCAGCPVALTERELQLFQHLFLHAGQIVPQTALATGAWRLDPTISSNGLPVYIGYLRRKLAKSRLTELVTVRGEGYGLQLRRQVHAASAPTKAAAPDEARRD